MVKTDKGKIAALLVIAVFLVFVSFSAGRFFERKNQTAGFYIAASDTAVTGPLPESPSEMPEPSAQAALVNINTAGEEELSSLPGLGPVLAGRIIEYREENGFFSSISDIMDVSGIGEAKYLAIRELICV